MFTLAYIVSKSNITVSTMGIQFIMTGNLWGLFNQIVTVVGMVWYGMVWYGMVCTRV